MTRVEAHAEARMAICSIDERRKLAHIATNRAALAGAVFQQQPRPVRAVGRKPRCLTCVERPQARLRNAIRAACQAGFRALV